MKPKDLTTQSEDSSLEGLEQRLFDLERQVQDQRQQLDNQEKVIEQLSQYRKSSLQYWASCLVPVSLKLFAVRQWRLLKHATTPRLGQLLQYPPKPLEIPSYYSTPIKTPIEQLPTISVVTPSYNQAQFIEATVKSVIEQNYPKLEYIIQDALSDDGTQDILSRYQEQVTQIESAPDNGQTNAINIGLHKATGDILAYLNSDDLYLPGTLNYVGEFFANNPDVDVVYGHRVNIDEQGLEVGRWIMPEHDNEVFKWCGYLPQETMFWRRSAWEKVGDFDETFRFAMDYDYILRMQNAELNFVRLPRFLGAFRVHNNQKTRAIRDVGNEEIRHLQKAELGYVPDDDEIAQQLKAYYKRHVQLKLLYGLGLKRY